MSNIRIGNLVAHIGRRVGPAHADPHRRGVADREIGSQRTAQMAAVDDDLCSGHVAPRRRQGLGEMTTQAAGGSR
jgi:hypothetical protein